jgi:DNA-binding response OmpR family regulator
MHVLLVEDDSRLADSLAEVLLAQRYIVDLARDGEAGWQQITSAPYDLVVMDVTLPKLDGLGLCGRMRDRGLTTPVLMLTARDTSSDKVLGLDAGADAYIPHSALSTGTARIN